ncbi:MAG: UDP-N-acetylglucosamine--N-acetylmuramyl-(pentapeptide) pyrophosphoryl-undecaprenol N-acetylglucosamine transferase [Clostridiales bacterium]|nr:UDP-N-acetylglucosamine--N-acetylmuramyl-(pentapeptide) pyrophosphoryl-undecaprenol N-acetylglucosamine transferase [Clostridiales bacterium]
MFLMHHLTLHSSQLHKDGRLRAIVAGGGTAGHIYPALAIAAALKERYDADILYMGAKHDLHGAPPRELALAESAGWPYIGVSAAGLSRRSPRILLDIVKNYRGIIEAKKHIRRFRPYIVIGTGGYAMAPVLRAAAALKIPTLLHEQNVCPGWANRYLARKVDMVCLTFAASLPFFSAKTHTKVTGLPVRRDIITANRAEAFAFWGIEGKEKERFTLLVTGGSQGARHLNEVLCSCYGELLAAGLRIIHLTGAAHIGLAVKRRKNICSRKIYMCCRI